MKRFGVNQRLGSFFRALLVVIFFSFGLSTLHAAALPIQDWSLWVSEGNTPTFTQELANIVECVEKEGVNVDRLPANVDDMTPCQRQVRNAVTYRDSEGRDLLQIYFKYSEPNYLKDPYSVLIIEEAMEVIEHLNKLGMILADWENERPSSDNLFFLAIKYDKLGLLNQLFTGIKVQTPERIPKLAEMRSTNNDSLADALMKTYPNKLEIGAMINDYSLVRDFKKLKHKSGLVYQQLLALKDFNKTLPLPMH
ncbi:hypothetical protein [Endozoicomonas lisbonensis]|uniref:Solute-binding protein family 3/N-terminal domain-containing protein n=1 Tax=Endozoicomonas lisbonensis TaxID=3120522 RepID=A0ABV2SB20_9GAMM